MEYLWLIMMCLCVYANNPDILSAAVSLGKMKSCSGDTLTNTHEVKLQSQQEEVQNKCKQRNNIMCTKSSCLTDDHFEEL